MKITKETQKDLDRRNAKEKKLKRRIFLMATRNRYSKLLGVKEPYTF